MAFIRIIQSTWKIPRPLAEKYLTEIHLIETEIFYFFTNGTERFKNCKQLLEYQNLPLLSDICQARLG
jgi:hypothetical protein